MHFIAAWEINSGAQETLQIDGELRSILKPYAWVRPLKSFYIVTVDSKETWNKVLLGLQGVGRKHERKVSLVISPLMVGGRYDGLLSKDLWDAINMRTK